MPFYEREDKILNALLLSAILSAAMSTADSQLLTSASAFAGTAAAVSLFFPVLWKRFLCFHSLVGSEKGVGAYC